MLCLELNAQRGKDQDIVSFVEGNKWINKMEKSNDLISMKSTARNKKYHRTHRWPRTLCNRKTARVKTQPMTNVKILFLHIWNPSALEWRRCFRLAEDYDFVWANLNGRSCNSLITLHIQSSLSVFRDQMSHSISSHSLKANCTQIINAVNRPIYLRAQSNRRLCTTRTDKELLAKDTEHKCAEILSGSHIS